MTESKSSKYAPPFAAAVTNMFARSLLWAVAVTSTALSGCAAGNTGTVGMAVTDAPADDWSAVNVTFSRGSVHRSASVDENATAGWQEIVNTTRSVDLIALHLNQRIVQGAGTTAYWSGLLVPFAAPVVTTYYVYRDKLPF